VTNLTEPLFTHAGNFARMVGQYPLLYCFYQPTRAAKILQRLGLQRAAEELLWRVSSAHPYDYALGEHLANVIYDHHEHEFREGTIERGRFLMQLLARSYLSPRIAEAYFRNLESVLDARDQLTGQGQIVLGLGPGRCGSTTLAALLHSVPGAISTHENPPLVFWEPLPRQVQFHLDRFRIFSRYFPLIADCAHWWINLLPVIFDAFPRSRAIGLYRESNACVRSWMGALPIHKNHWIGPYSHLWLGDRWDPCFPSYDLPEGAKSDRRRGREVLLRRYVTEYNERLHALAALYAQRMLLLRTEDLDLPSTREGMSDFLGLPVSKTVIRLNNKGTITDIPSEDDAYF
jgi:hypothetical protein